MERGASRPGLRIAFLLAACAGFLSAGCSYVGSARDFDPEEFKNDAGWIAVPDAPFLPQNSRNDCGAAAVAMAISYWGVPTSVEEVAAGCPHDPGGDGIKAGALREFARRKGLEAFLIHGDMEDIRKELSKRRPVVVGLVKPHLAGGLSHYEVVAGLHPDRRIVVTLDPAHGWRQNGFDGFSQEWDPTKRLLLVMFKGSGGLTSAGDSQ